MTYEQIEKDVPKYKNGSKAIPKDEIVIPYSAFKQSFIKYLQSEVERLEKTVQKDPYELEVILEEDKGKITDVMLRNCVKMLKNQDGKEFRWGYNQAISDQITHIKSQIKELQ